VTSTLRIQLLAAFSPRGAGTEHPGGRGASTGPGGCQVLWAGLGLGLETPERLYGTAAPG